MDAESEDVEGAEQTDISESSRKRLITVSAAFAIALVLVLLFGMSRTTRAKLDSLKMDTAALAASMKYPLLEAKSLRTDAGRDRLQPMVAEITKAGGYVYVVLTDEKGEVLASTDLNLLGKNLKEVTEASKGPLVERNGDVLRATAPVLVGGSPIGYLRVDVER